MSFVLGAGPFLASIQPQVGDAVKTAGLMGGPSPFDQQLVGGCQLLGNLDLQTADVPL